MGYNLLINLMGWSLVNALYDYYISSTYSDLKHDQTPPKGSWAREMGPLISGKSMLVKYDLARLYNGWKKDSLFFGILNTSSIKKAAYIVICDGYE